MYEIAPPDGIEYILTDANGTTDDIITAIKKADGMAAPYTYQFAQSIPKGSIDDVCYYLWDWVQRNIKYKEDPAGIQRIQLPAALNSSKQGDCKSMTLFTASVIDNLYGPIYRYRFISQDANEDYHHVYLVVRDENGEDIILDCVENWYGHEVPHVKQKDMNPRSIYRNGPRLNGVYGYTSPAGTPISTQVDYMINPISTPVDANGFPVISNAPSQSQNNTAVLVQPDPAANTTTGMSTTTMVVGGIAAALALYFIFKD